MHERSTHRKDDVTEYEWIFGYGANKVIYKSIGLGFDDEFSLF